MAIVTIIGAGMMGSALAFPARENGHEVRLVGTHLDREIIDTSIKTQRHPKFNKDFPDGIKYYQIEDVDDAISGSDMIARAIKKAAELGNAKLEDFPLLMHIDEIITQRKPVSIPWEDFTFKFNK